MAKRRPSNVDPGAAATVPATSIELAAARRHALPVPRLVGGWLLALAGTPLLTVLLLGVRKQIVLPSVLLLFLVLVVVVAALGGIWPSLVAAIGSFFLVNWFFTPPYNTLTIQHSENVLALAVFVGVATVVSTLVSLAARRTTQAARARVEAEVIAKTGITLLGSHDPLTDLLGLLRSTFGLEAAAVLRPSSSGWRVVAHSGTPCPTSVEHADRSVPIDEDAHLAMSGDASARVDRRVLDAFVAQLASAIRHEDLRAQATAARQVAEANELRAALLAGVSHDLRTPLSSIKASVTSLLQEEITWPIDTTREFLVTIDAETDRLNKLVGNLLDMSRLRTGSVRPTMRVIGVEEVVGGALASLGERGKSITVDVLEWLPSVHADPALLERSLANLLDNALVHGSGSDVHLVGGSSGETVSLSVVDRGIGIPEEERLRAFEPFQRLGDGTNRSGVGLGLAVTLGFVEAMGGSLALEETPGGGLTARVSLRRADT